jgi:hypothetical protein
MTPYKTRREPRCHSPSSSRRRTRRWGELVPPAHPPHHGPCSCAGPCRAAVSGTSRCPRGAKKTRHRHSIRTKTCTHTDPNWKNIKVEDSPGRRGCTPQVPWGSLCCRSARRRCSSREPSSSPWIPCAVRPGLGQFAPSTQRPDGPGPSVDG